MRQRDRATMVASHAGTAIGIVRFVIGALKAIFLGFRAHGSLDGLYGALLLRRGREAASLVLATTPFARRGLAGPLSGISAA